MACMCGDICCNSCGPAQGNWRCPICREWASEGCIHIDGDNIRPEFQAEVERIAALQAAADEQYARDLEEPMGWTCSHCYTANGSADRNCVNCNRRRMEQW